MSQRVLFMRLYGAIFPSRTSSPHQCGSSTSPGRNGFCRSSRSTFRAFRRRQASGVSLPPGSLPSIFAVGFSGAQGRVHRQASDHFDRAASQSSSSARSITEQLCLPSLSLTYSSRFLEARFLMDWRPIPAHQSSGTVAEGEIGQNRVQWAHRWAPARQQRLPGSARSWAEVPCPKTSCP